MMDTSAPRYKTDEVATRTNQYVDLAPGEPVHERHDLHIELIQRHVEVYYERVEGIVIIRDPDIQVLFCSYTISDPGRPRTCVKADL